MKKLFFYTLFALLALIGQAQKPATISGTAAKDVYAKGALYKIINGRTEEIATSVPDGQGNFGFLFVLGHEGFYVVGKTGQANMVNAVVVYYT